MNISAISSNSSLLGIESALGTKAQKQASSSVFTSESDSIVLQHPGGGKAYEFFQQLQELQSSDPEAFKETMAGLADQLRTKAEESTDSREKEFLTKLADSFEASSKSGQLELPKPPARSDELYGPQGANGHSRANNERPPELDLLSLLSSSKEADAGDAALEQLWESLAS